MRVAKFDPNTGNRLDNYESSALKNSLDPNLPVWVVVHGRANSEESSQIAELTRNLQALGTQVVTLDWEKGAGDNFIPKVGLEGQKWIEAVGIWAANQLKAAGFIGENINVIGHSWGVYASYEIGAHIPGGVKTLMALDPAADQPILGGGIYKGFNDPNFKFSHVANNSYAFHSSNLGNRKNAISAEYSFEIRAKEGYESESSIQAMARNFWTGGVIGEVKDEIADALREHSFSVSLFSELLSRNKINPKDPTASLFSLENLRSDADEVLKQEGFDGIFYASPAKRVNSIGKEKDELSWATTTFGFATKDIFGKEIYNPRTL